MSSINDQAWEYFNLSEGLDAATEYMRELAEETMRKRERYFNMRESSDLTADEAIQANNLRVEVSKGLEELRALRKELAADRERMRELNRSLEAAGF